MLVGREAELQELLGGVATVCTDGRGFTALIGGEPGIGKTRLVAECVARLRAEGVTVVWAACRQDGGAPPYWPWVQLLGRLGHSDALRASQQAEPEFARFLFFEAVAGALRAAAPVVLVLDDLHWADQPSLRLLDALGAHVGAAPVVVLGTYRDTEPGAAESVTAERRIVLRAAAVLDAGATTGVDGVLLATVAGVVPAELAERLDPAVAARRLMAGGGRYRFPHALVADTVTIRTPAGQRLDLHRRAAATLDIRVPTGAGDPAEAAHQRLAAARLSGDASEAAAATATALGGTAYEDAVGWLEAAIAVLPSDAAELDRGEVLCALGDAALAAGDTRWTLWFRPAASVSLVS